MKKVGLITIYHVPNYGSVLQTFATQVLLEKLGLDCHIINYRYPNKWHYSQGTLKPGVKTLIGCLFGLKASHRKANKLRRFRINHFHFTQQFNDLKELETADWSQYDMFVVGSDQVWKSYFTHADSVFMLSFIPDTKYRVSIASSFATNSVPEIYRKKYIQYLSKFNSISVRERNAVNIICNELKLDYEPKVILDPTLLITKEEWLDTIPRSKFKKRKKYILLYMLTYAFEPRPYIYEVLKHLQSKEDYSVIALEGNIPVEYRKGIDFIDKTDASIPEFIDLFHNADIVLTTSFHGTAFAVNFGKPLVSVIPSDAGDDRQESLLNEIGLSHLIVSIGDDLNSINPFYDQNAAMLSLNIMRNKSLEWIKGNMLIEDF